MHALTKVILITAFIFIYLPNLTLAQAPDTLWTKTFGGIGQDWGLSVQQTTDSGYITCGRTESFGVGGGDIWLIKTDAYGDTLWTKTFGGGSDDGGYAVQQTIDGGYIITGYTHSFGAGNNDVWLIKTNASGDLLWTKTFGGVYSESGRAVQQTTDGGYIITGHTYSTNGGDYDIWLIKTDASGDTLWTKTIGGIDRDFGYSVQQTSDGGYIISGNLDFANGVHGDIWLIKTDAYGDTLWARTFGGAMRNECYSVQQTTDGGYIITGNTSRFPAASKDVWLIKTNASGDTLWTKMFGGEFVDKGYAVQQTTDGGYIITGYTNSFGAGNFDFWLIKTNASGDLLWEKTFGGSNNDWGKAVQLTTDGGYIIIGYTTSFGAGSSDIWLIKTTPDISDIEQNNSIIISDFSLHQNYPNPFNPNTRIKYQIPELSFVTLKVYDVLGNEVATLINEEKPVGSYEIEFDATTLPSGIYFYKLQAGSFVETRKMVLMK